MTHQKRGQGEEGYEGCAYERSEWVGVRSVKSALVVQRPSLTYAGSKARGVGLPLDVDWPPRNCPTPTCELTCGLEYRNIFCLLMHVNEVAVGNKWM